MFMCWIFFGVSETESKPNGLQCTEYNAVSNKPLLLVNELAIKIKSNNKTQIVTLTVFNFQLDERILGFLEYA